jgi:hypothetical protein
MLNCPGEAAKKATSGEAFARIKKLVDRRARKDVDDCVVAFP